MTRAALRKLWLSDPVFANLDGLNDYDEDFNVVDTLLSALESAKKALPEGTGGEAAEEDEAVAEVAEVDRGDEESAEDVETAGEVESDTTRGARIFTKKVVTKPRSRARTFRIMMTSGGHPHGRAIG